MLKRLLAAAIVAWPTAGMPAKPKPLFTQQELKTVHVCFVGTMIAYCSGKKEIATGVMLADRLTGEPVPPGFEPRQDGPAIAPNGKVDLQYLGVVQIDQIDPVWEAKIYILDAPGIQKIIAYARAHPNWKGP